MRTDHRTQQFAVAAALVVVAACGGGADDVRVFAAASLTDVLGDLDAAYDAGEVEAVVASSTAVVRQVLDGAEADVVLTADAEAMAPIVEAGIARGPAVEVATTDLVVAVTAGNPEGVRWLADLADLDRVSICDPSVPCGRVAGRTLAATDVAVPGASREANVRAALAKVRLGEADAALVYRTDVLAAGDDVEAVPIPGTEASTTYRGIALTDAGTDFLDWLVSPEGRSVLREAGFDR